MYRRGCARYTVSIRPDPAPVHRDTATSPPGPAAYDVPAYPAYRPEDPDAWRRDLDAWLAELRQRCQSADWRAWYHGIHALPAAPRPALEPPPSRRDRLRLCLLKLLADDIADIALAVCREVHR